MSENLGGIYIDIELESAQLLDGARKVNEALSGMGSNAGKASGNFDGVGKSANSAGKSIARSADDASQAAKVMERLGNEVAILEEANGKGARSAVVLAAQLRAGSTATSAQTKEIGELAGKLYDLKHAQDQTNTSQQKSTGIMGGLKTGLTAIASAMAISQLVQYGKQFIDIADAMTQLQARIYRLSSSAKEGSATLQALSDIASSSGSSLKETASLWEKLTSSLKGGGASNTQILALTDTLQKIGRIGGSSSEEMSNALRQFGQSIDGGVIRAQEFNSILEQMPELSRQMAAGLGISVGELRKRMLEGKLSAEDALNAISNRTGAVNQEFSKLPRTTEQATNSLTISFQGMVKQMNDATGASTGMVHVIDSVTAAIDRLSGRIPNATQQISDLNSTADMFARRARTYSWLGLDGWSAQAEGINAVSNKAANLIGDLAAISKASASASKQPIKVSGTGDSKEMEKLEKSTKRKLELSKLEGEARARLQAQYDAEDAGITDSNRIKALKDEYAATQKNTAATKEGNAEAKKSASQAEAIAQKLANLRQQSELNADSTQQLSREQAVLNAQQSLGKGASQEQISLAGKYAAQKWDTANAIKAQVAAEKLLPETKGNLSYKQDVNDLKTALDAKKITQQQYYQISEKLEQDHQTKLAEIRANQVVTPQQDATAKVDPVQQLANENARKLALIQQFEANKTLTHDQAEALRNATNTQYEQQRIAAQWTIYRNQSVANELLASSIESFSSGASSAITGLINGTQSLSESFANLGTSILNGVVSSLVQMGTQWVMSTLMGQAAQESAIAANQATSIAALAASTSAGIASASALLTAWSPAAMAASVASYGGAATAGLAGYTTAMTAAQTMSIAGARKNGGPVSADSMYRVGEGGKPEIFKASNGNQYMIPGDNGSVISNKDIGGSGGGGGGVVMNVAFNIQTSGGIDDATQKQMAKTMENVAMKVVKEQSSRPGGILQPRK